MKRKLLALASLVLALPLAANAMDTHPASQEWVLAQLAGYARIMLPTDWTNLCPAGQSLDSRTGCTPNCSSQPFAATCSKFLAVSELQDQVLLQSTAPYGMTFFRLTVRPTFVNSGPTYANSSATNQIRCQTFTPEGHLLTDFMPNDNNTTTADSIQEFTAVVELSTSQGPFNTELMDSSPDAGSQRVNQQYYVACMSFTNAGNTATNVNMDGKLSILWS